MTTFKDIVFKNKAILMYSLSLAMLLFLLRWLEFRLIHLNHSFEIYVACIAVLFTGLGIWLARKLSRPKTETVYVEKEVIVRAGEPFVLNETLLRQLEISPREIQILNLIALGMSNQEIADNLFVSLSTVKTHVQNLFEKLEVKRRLQAVEKSKRLNLLP